MKEIEIKERKRLLNEWWKIERRGKERKGEKEMKNKRKRKKRENR